MKVHHNFMFFMQDPKDTACNQSTRAEVDIKRLKLKEVDEVRRLPMKGVSHL